MLLIPNTYHINKVNPRSTCSCSLTYNQMKLPPPPPPPKEIRYNKDIKISSSN